MVCLSFRAVGRAALAALALVTTGGAAWADGFITRDLTALAIDPSVLGRDGGDGQWMHRAEPERVTFFCMGCSDMQPVDVLMGNGDRGTEQRLRSGETTVADLEALCRAPQDDCRVMTLNVPPAVGWLSSWTLGDTFGATAVILHEGDMLTVRAIADGAEAATKNVRSAVDHVAPKLLR